MSDGPIQLDNDLNLPEPCDVSIGGAIIRLDWKRYPAGWLSRYTAWQSGADHDLIVLNSLLHEALDYCNPPGDGRLPQGAVAQNALEQVQQTIADVRIPDAELRTRLHAIITAIPRAGGGPFDDLDPVYQSRVLSAFTTGRWGGAPVIAAVQKQPSPTQAQTAPPTTTETRNSRRSRVRRVA